MHTMQDIAQALSAMKFRRKLLGGVEEADVWRQLESLQQLYQRVYEEQAAYYQALLEERDRELAQLTGPRNGSDPYV